VEFHYLLEQAIMLTVDQIQHLSDREFARFWNDVRFVRGSLPSLYARFEAEFARRQGARDEGDKMGTCYYACGCWVTTQMLPPYQTIHVDHCQNHADLFSDEKTLKQMAIEIIEANGIKRIERTTEAKC